jgi:oligosaccharyl transferase (archaeosortase A-associated)
MPRASCGGTAGIEGVLLRSLRVTRPSHIISQATALHAMTDKGARFRPTGRLLTITVVAGSVVVALAIRILWPYDNVFVDGSVWFRGMDAWYHMRLVDNLVHNFPHLTAFDPFTWYPHGVTPPFRPLTGWLIAGAAMLAGGGAPSPETIDTTGALFPAVLGAMAIVPAYFIGRRLYGRLAGAVAAFLLAVLPGEFLSRSLLGFADHHVAEAFFATTTLLFLMLATERASSCGLTLRGLSRELSTTARSPVVYTAIAGVSLGLYLLAWRGGLLLLLILVLYALTRGIVDYAEGKSRDDVMLVCCGAVAIGGLMVSPFVATHYMANLYVLALVATFAMPVAMRLLSVGARRLEWSARVFAAFLAGAAAALVLAVAAVSPGAFASALKAIDFMVPTGASLTITEMHPLFLPSGRFSLDIAWTNFVTILPVSLVALVVLWRSHRSPRGNHVTLFVVWSLVMLVAVLSQRRFGYYFALNAAVLTGLLVSWILHSGWCAKQAGLLARRIPTATRARSKAERRAIRTHRAQRRDATLRLGMVAAVLSVALVVPSVTMARNFAAEPSLMTDGWYETLQWLGSNTPDPMGQNAYYEMHEDPGAGVDFDYPAGAYSIMAWWDYGHWVTRVSHRIPVCNPFQQGARVAAGFFLAQSESEGNPVLQTLDSRFVVVDVKTSVPAFYGVAAWGGHERAEYLEVYNQQTQSGEWESIVLYYPQYYNSMLVRLYNFSAQAFQPEEFTVVRCSESPGVSEGRREILGVEHFPSYEEALSYLDESGADNLRLVSSDPMVSAVPLEALRGYSLAFESSSRTMVAGHLVPEVRVFEYSEQ